MDNEKLINLYNDVFDQSGNIKTCGRNKCIALISYMNTITNSSSYGSVETGKMNVKSIKDFMVEHKLV